jgi:hypothetical protein
MLRLIFFRKITSQLNIHLQELRVENYSIAEIHPAILLKVPLPSCGKQQSGCGTEILNSQLLILN